MQDIKSVHKFGGSSLKSADRFHVIADILSKKDQVIVVSAIGNTTRVLRQGLQHALSKQDYLPEITLLKTRHTKIANELLPDATSYIDDLDHDLNALADIYHAVNLVGSITYAIEDMVLSYGEIWSSKLTALFLDRNALFVDAAHILSVEKKHNLCIVDWDVSKQKLDAFLVDKRYDNLVITGYTAADKEGRRITLGFNGSDHSGAIFAKLFGVDVLTIWTDVDGIYTADPRIVKQAHVLPSLSYEEATELAYFGAKVIHPQAMAPAMDCQIPIHIRNSYNPEAAGSCISATPDLSRFDIRGLSGIDDVALITIAGSGMTGVSGIANHVFDTLNQAEIPVLVISQASSEHSICLAVYEKHLKQTVSILKERLHRELLKGLVQNITFKKDCAVLAVVGDAMVGKPGISAKLLNHLAKANINILAIAQGGSERNITVVVENRDLKKALRVSHSGFYLSDKMISIGLIGPGNVGKAFMKQLAANVERLKDKMNIDLRVQGICSSQKMLLASEAIPLKDFDYVKQETLQPVNMTEFSKHIISEEPPHAVIIDCSASPEIASLYAEFMQKGLHVITPNKQASSGDLHAYLTLKAKAKQTNRHYLYETNVCAGLPIIKTLQDLIDTGDEIESIEGVFSGTLSYIFNELSSGKPFSLVVKAAYDKGFTEPDPRDDLSGLDVARKSICLARELGAHVSLAQVAIEPILPETLNQGDIKHFLSQGDVLDALYAEKMDKLINENKKIIYVARIMANGTINLGLKEIDITSPFYGLQGTDNMVIFKTKRYLENPLVVQGPGAGSEVTAAGVFADLLRLASLVSD